MKKVCYLLFALLLLIPMIVFAADPKVLTLEASVDGSTVSFSGTSEDGMTAVMCKLFAEDDDTDAVERLSVAVDDNKFSGEMNDIASGKYNLRCANYESGEIKSVDVEVEKEETSDEPIPPTGINYTVVILIAGLSFITLLGVRKRILLNR